MQPAQWQCLQMQVTRPAAPSPSLRRPLGSHPRCADLCRRPWPCPAGHISVLTGHRGQLQTVMGPLGQEVECGEGTEGQ